jgi:GrpB-like predicted nucleotidyltransferase (UPF0157 family)
LTAYDRGWREAYTREVVRIREATATSCHFDHVGSTAIPGLNAKPIIDILISPKSWSDAAATVQALASLGYTTHEQIDGDAPRRFLVLPPSRSQPAIHVHIVPENGSWGKRMVAFRDAVLADRKLRHRYAALKRELALKHGNDLKGYTDGKAGFVRDVVFRIENAFSTDMMLTHQRAELGRAQLLQVLALATQFLVALVAAGSVFVNASETLLGLAVAGLLLAGAWLQISRWRDKHRNAGNRARRVVLLTSGLDANISAEQHRRLSDGFTVPIMNRPLMLEDGYFASRATPGPRRLVELIEESAYWTADLQRYSSHALGVAMGVALVVTSLIVWRTITDMDTAQQVLIARVLVAALVFLVSSDVVVHWLAHRRAATDIDEILSRIEVTVARGHDQTDVTLLMSDYNAIVEAAPNILPLVFVVRRGHLKSRWRAYLTKKQVANEG